ncbi:kinase suppressor of Ras 1-like isoform 2-T2 [Polymixia lowei]
MAVPVKLSLDVWRQMSSSDAQDGMRRLGCNSEERPRLTAALSCLNGATETGGDPREDAGSWSCEPPRKDSATSPPVVPRLCSLGSPGPHSPIPSSSSTLPPGRPSSPRVHTNTHGRSISISVVPCSDDRRPCISTENMADAFPSSPATPPVTPPSKRCAAKPAQTPPPASRKLLQLLPDIALTRSKSHESQLVNCIEEPAPNKAGKMNKLLVNIQTTFYGNSSEDPAVGSPLLSDRTPIPAPAAAPCVLPGTPTLLENNLAMRRSSPQTMRRDIGLPVTHRFSTKSWLSQTCQVCRKSMMFGVKCKHCKLKCHNKCTKEAPSCRISFLPLKRIRRAESVPSDINNQIDCTATLPLQFGTLPKALTKKEHPPMLKHLDSNPSSATSSPPSSPAPLQPSISVTPPPNPSSQGLRDGLFHFPDVPTPPYTVNLQSDGYHDAGVLQLADAETELTGQQRGVKGEVEECRGENEEGVDQCDTNRGYSEGECDEDALEDLPSSGSCRRTRGRWRGPISRNASQASVYLQEWDIPYEQLELDELIGEGRWGKVHKGRWHGEVAIRLLEIDGNNQDHLKLFKKEVMNYRQTRHENVVLFMGACMAPPHLAIITSFCKGRTLFSVVRDSKDTLDINKTRQIAQEIVKGMGYLHAKGIVHKDLKSKNVFYDTNKVVITDFGLFGMSGVVQEGRENKLRLPQGWIYYLAPEIVQRMGPENDQDQLPFSTAADVYAFGTIWYELQVRGWPLINHPVEAKIWLVGSGEGVKKVLADVSLGKEVTEILSACWSFEAGERPSFSQLADMLERLPKLNRRLSHPGHFWKSAEPWCHHFLQDYSCQGLHSHCPYIYKYSS